MIRYSMNDKIFKQVGIIVMDYSYGWLLIIILTKNNSSFKLRDYACDQSEGFTDHKHQSSILRCFDQAWLMIDDND